jgi:hypothetical protein
MPLDAVVSCVVAHAAIQMARSKQGVNRACVRQRNPGAPSIRSGAATTTHRARVTRTNYAAFIS